VGGGTRETPGKRAASAAASFIYRFNVRARNAACARDLSLIPIHTRACARAHTYTQGKPIFSAGPEPIIDIRCLVPRPIDIAYARLSERENTVL